MSYRLGTDVDDKLTERILHLPLEEIRDLKLCQMSAKLRPQRYIKAQVEYHCSTDGALGRCTVDSCSMFSHSQRQDEIQSRAQKKSSLVVSYNRKEKF